MILNRTSSLLTFAGGGVSAFKLGSRRDIEQGAAVLRSESRYDHGVRVRSGMLRQARRLPFQSDSDRMYFGQTKRSLPSLLAANAPVLKV